MSGHATLVQQHSYLCYMLHCLHPSQGLGKLSWLVLGLSLNEEEVRSYITMDQSHSHASKHVRWR